MIMNAEYPKPKERDFGIFGSIVALKRSLLLDMADGGVSEQGKHSARRKKQMFEPSYRNINDASLHPTQVDQLSLALS